MPSDQFFGGVGVDSFYPQMSLNNTFSEPEWNSPNIAPLPADFENPYPTPSSRPPPIEVSSIPHHMLNIPRPKSSPSTFGPNVEDLLFPENPYRFKSDEFRDYPSITFPISPISAHHPKSSPYYPHEFHSARTSPSRHAPIPIAPDPVGLRQLNALKRMRDEDDFAEFGQRKRKRAVSNPGPVELNEEETLLLKLKEEESLPWKDIAVRFQTELGKTYQVPALQMRFKRLRERMRNWTETDVSALEQAYEYWEKYQFDIISAKMLDFGASERWPAKQCARKWEELHPNHVPYRPSTAFLADPWASEHCSPVESLIHSPRPQYARSYDGRSPRPSPSPRPSLDL